MDEPTWLSDTLHCPMIPPTLLQFEQSEAVAAAGLAQGTLVEELLPWTGSEFLSDLLRLRSEIDETLHAADDGLTPEMRAKYPLGACKPIRDAGLARLLGCSAADETRPAFQAIRRFRSRGGLVKGIWGIQKGIYFQNAIQAGDLWVDLANDTVDRTRVPVEICRLADARFEEIESFGRFAEVTRVYWGLEAYPNHILPAVAAILPVLLVSPEGAMRLATPKTLLPRNIRLDYSLAEEFLRTGDWAVRCLPDPLLQRLDQLAHTGSGWFARAPAWCTRLALAAGPDHAAAVVAAERAERSRLDDTDYTRRFFEMIRAASQLVTN